MNNLEKNNKGGFIAIILVIVIALLVLRYFGITISGVIDWIISLFRGVIR